MKGFTATGLFLLVWAFAAIVWEFVAIFVWGRDATISVVVWSYAKEYPILALALGVLMGHFFWQFAKG